MINQLNKLKEVHGRLRKNFPNYISMIAIGSITNDDKWIEGRSDNDILLMFESLPEDYITRINLLLSEMDFDDTYNIVPMLKGYWLPNRKHSHDFSGKFRSRTLFGHDLIPEKQIPSKEEATEIYSAGIENVKRRITRTLVNEGHLSEKKVKDIFWKLFKHSLMYLAIKYHCDTGKYPRSRKNLAKALDKKVITEVLETLNNINMEEKSKIVFIGSELLRYLENHS